MMLKQNKEFLAGIIISAITASCNAGGLTGGSSQAKKDPVPSSTPTPTVAPTPSNQCTETRLISVTSLTNAVDQSNPSRSIDVQLTFEPCPNQKTELSYPVLFDLDAVMDFGTSGSRNLNYEVSGANVPASSGTVNFVTGTDLFGKSGQNYGHFSSSTAMKIAPNLTTAILKIRLNTLAIIAKAGDTNYPTTNFPIPLHVKIGAANPVTGNVTFTPMR